VNKLSRVPCPVSRVAGAAIGVMPRPATTAVSWPEPGV